MRHSIQGNLLETVTDTHRDADQLSVFDLEAAPCSAARTGAGYWTCDVPAGCSDCRTLAAELDDLAAFDLEDVTA